MSRAPLGTRAELKLPPDVQPGALLAGRYRVGRMLGAGGMGAVFAAEHVDLREPVAIKVLLNDGSTQASPEALSRFMREAWAASKIKSEYVARVNDLGRLDNGTPYIVMEYLDGNDLEELLRVQGPLSIELAVELTLQACEALAEAHALGIFHRDLKPSNLFCVQRSDGLLAIKLLDFGISKISRSSSESDPRLTSTATTLGTPLYMSPEQMRSGRLADERSEIWSLGVILYEMLCGHVPFCADNLADLAVKIATERPVPLCEERQEVPIELSEVIGRCIDRERSQRFGSVAELARALAPFGPTRALAHAERAERILQAMHTATPKARITPMTISTAITAMGSHARLRGVGSERGSSARRRRLPIRVLWIAGAVLFGAATTAAVRWAISRPAPPVPSVVLPKPAETRTHAAEAVAPVAPKPIAADVVDPLPSVDTRPSAASPADAAALTEKSTPPPKAAGATDHSAQPAANAAEPQRATDLPASPSKVIGTTDKSRATTAQPPATPKSADAADESQRATQPTAPPKAANAAATPQAVAKPAPPPKAARTQPPKAATATPAEPQPSAAPKSKSSELDSLGGRL